MSQELQDENIKLEFKKVYGLFDEQRSYMDGRFDEQRSYMDGRFKKVDERFDKVDERLGKVDQRFDRIEDRQDRFQESLDQLTAMSFNSKATRSWSNIHAIGVFDPLAQPGSRYRMPQYFPNKVAKFWHLQRPSNRKISHPITSIDIDIDILIDQKLIDLIKFYNIQGLESGNSISLIMATMSPVPAAPQNHYPLLSKPSKQIQR